MYYPTNTFMAIPPFLYRNAQGRMMAADLQTRIYELQMQQCCANQSTWLGNALALQNAITISFPAPYPVEDDEDIIYKMDKILFPDDPIRDYINEEIRKVNEKYAERIKMFDQLLSRY